MLDKSTRRITKEYLNSYNSGGGKRGFCIDCLWKAVINVIMHTLAKTDGDGVIRWRNDR
jgi:hypothetical protein